MTTVQTLRPPGDDFRVGLLGVQWLVGCRNGQSAQNSALGKARKRVVGQFESGSMSSIRFPKGSST
jgi:hypothetical protein